MNLSIEEFFQLSWFEFGLHVKRNYKRQENNNLREEFEWLRIRKIWVLMINYMRDSKTKPTPFKETDLIKLSFDKDEEAKEKPMTPEEVEKLFPKTLNRKNGNI